MQSIQNKPKWRRHCFNYFTVSIRSVRHVLLIISVMRLAYTSILRVSAVVVIEIALCLTFLHASSCKMAYIYYYCYGLCSMEAVIENNRNDINMLVKSDNQEQMLLEKCRDTRLHCLFFLGLKFFYGIRENWRFSDIVSQIVFTNVKNTLMLVLRIHNTSMMVIDYQRCKLLLSVMNSCLLR